MAWTTSAASGKAVARRQWLTLRSGILMAHLAFLALLWHDRSASALTAATNSAAVDVSRGALDPATFAILSGIFLALVYISRSFSMSVLSMLPRASTTRLRRTWHEAGPAPAIETRRVHPQPSSASPHTLPNDAYIGLMSRLHHDLRTPLNAMMGFADLMNAEVFGPLGNERYRAYAAHMQTCGRELLEATETTLTMAALLTRPHHHDTATRGLEDLVAEAWHETVRGRPEDAKRLTVGLAPSLTIKGDIPSIKQGLVTLLGVAISHLGSYGPISITASGSHGRINVAISVQASGGTSGAATGCRQATSGCPAIEALPTAISRTLFSLQGIPFVEMVDATGTWSASLSFEAAAQSDLFDEGGVPGNRSRNGAYSAGFLTGGSLSASPSI